MAIQKKILVLAGDHVGPEIINKAVKVLDVLSELHPDVQIAIKHGLIGGKSIDTHGVPITDETLNEAAASDAVLLGSVGG